MANIHDVARAAGVSIKTVSRVLNGEPNVSLKTKAAVEVAIDTLNYVPSHFARAMKSGQSKTIAFVTDSVVTSPESIDIAKGVAEAAAESGLALFFLASEPDKSPFEGPNFDFIRSVQVDGLIFATHSHREIEVPEHLLEQPLVLVNCFEFAGRVSSVVPDDRQGGYLAGQLLLEKGHENIAFLNLSKDVVAAGLRQQGLNLAFEREGLEPPQCVFLRHEAAEGYADDLAHNVKQIMSAPKPPSALFCGNDKTAIMVYGALQQLGFRVPADVSLLGYDNFTIIAELLSPGLTTIAIPYLEMGREAITVLQDVIDKQVQNQVRQPAKIQIPGWPVHRETVRPR